MINSNLLHQKAKAYIIQQNITSSFCEMLKLPCVPKMLQCFNRFQQHGSIFWDILYIREMWDLINVNDNDKLSVDQLESGMATVTR